MNGDNRTPKTEPNWDNVPQEFRYLIDVTKEFAPYFADLEEFHPTDEELELLGRTAKRIQENGGMPPILD